MSTKNSSARIVRSPFGPRKRLDALIDVLVDHVVGDLPLAAIGRLDRFHASPAVRRRAEQSDALLLDLLHSTLARLRPDLAEAVRQARVQALLGAIWSVTHADLRLDPRGLSEYLRRAGRAVVLGRRPRRS